MVTKRKNFKVSLHESRTLNWWYARRKKIDMNPPYQRQGHLWSLTDKAYLIDSIINGYDVPKIYVADFTWGDSKLNQQKLPYAIIDGKQRFEAIFDFFDGKVVLNDDFVFIEDTTRKLGGLGYGDLQKNHIEIAELFENYNLTVMSVVAQSEDPINELFVRLNRSKSLTGAEIRNAMAGPAPKLMRQLAKHDFFMTNVTFEVKRGQDLNAAAKILLFEFYGEMHETKKNNLDNFVKNAMKSRDKLELAGRRVVEVLDDMASIFLPADKLLASAGIFPVYYWFVRSREPKDYPRIREFLVNFENTRGANRMLLKEDPINTSIDRELVEYDNFNRSTNDQTSHIRRFEILTNRFEKKNTRQGV